MENVSPEFLSNKIHFIYEHKCLPDKNSTKDELTQKLFDAITLMLDPIVVELLLKLGADPNDQSEEGNAIQYILHGLSSTHKDNPFNSPSLKHNYFRGDIYMQYKMPSDPNWNDIIKYTDDDNYDDTMVKLLKN